MSKNQTSKGLKGDLIKHENLIKSIPNGWPKEITFLENHSIASPGLPFHLQKLFCVAPKLNSELHPIKLRNKGFTQIKKITSSTPFIPAFESELKEHPAIGQFGLFAAKDIPSHTLILPYLGLVHLSNESDNESQYDAAIQSPDGTSLGIDATEMGSEARFINDYRGILIRPNVFFKEWSAKTNDDDQNFNKVYGLALYTESQSIRANTELCVSYGKGWWNARRLENEKSF